MAPFWFEASAGGGFCLPGLLPTEGIAADVTALAALV
jgi:hypothetical protein